MTLLAIPKIDTIESLIPEVIENREANYPEISSYENSITSLGSWGELDTDSQIVAKCNRSCNNCDIELQKEMNVSVEISLDKSFQADDVVSLVGTSDAQQESNVELHNSIRSEGGKSRRVGLLRSASTSCRNLFQKSSKDSVSSYAQPQRGNRPRTLRTRSATNLISSEITTDQIRNSSSHVTITKSRQRTRPDCADQEVPCKGSRPTAHRLHPRSEQPVKRRTQLNHDDRLAPTHVKSDSPSTNVTSKLLKCPSVTPSSDGINPQQYSYKNLDALLTEFDSMFVQGYRDKQGSISATGW